MLDRFSLGRARWERKREGEKYVATSSMSFEFSRPGACSLPVEAAEMGCRARYAQVVSCSHSLRFRQGLVCSISTLARSTTDSALFFPFHPPPFLSSPSLFLVSLFLFRGCAETSPACLFQLISGPSSVSTVSLLLSASKLRQG